MTLFITGLLMVGCQLSEKESTQPIFAQPRGSEICEQLVAAYCDRCDGTTVWSYEECLDRDEIKVDCDTTINVGSKHEECLEDIEAGVCGDPLPPACYDVVIVDQ